MALANQLVEHRNKFNNSEDKPEVEKRWYSMCKVGLIMHVRDTMHCSLGEAKLMVEHIIEEYNKSKTL